MRNFIHKLAAKAVLLAFFIHTALPVPVYGQLLTLPPVGQMVSISPSFTPVSIKGIKIFPDNPLRFDFIVDTGNSGLDAGNAELHSLQEESTRLIKYFLAALTTPEKDMWVNLSPYEQDRIVPEFFGQTEMGRDLLAQDYILKQLTASLMYPENELGKTFWDAIYEKAYAEYGTTEIPVNTFNKVWITPDKAVVYENADTAFVMESRLKVMLESDYEALQQAQNEGNADLRSVQDNNSQELGESIIRQIILPAIEKEVNEGEHFAQLRQIYHSLILATWFKMNLKESLLGQIYVDQSKVAGVDVEDKDIENKIYQQYLDAFKKGVYDYVKEDVDVVTQEIIPRKYFSGGFSVSPQFRTDIEIVHTVTSPIKSEGTFIRVFNQFKKNSGNKELSQIKNSSSGVNADLIEQNQKINLRLFSDLSSEEQDEIREEIFNWTIADGDGNQKAIFSNLYRKEKESSDSLEGFINEKLKKQNSDFLKEREPPLLDALLAFQGNKPVGIIRFDNISIVKHKRAIEDGVYIDPAMRGYELGPKLILSLLDYLQEIDMDVLQLTFDPNLRAQRLAEKTKNLTIASFKSESLLDNGEGGIRQFEVDVQKHVKTNWYAEGVDLEKSSIGSSPLIKGGIDFNPNNLNLQTQGVDYNVPIDPQLLEELTSTPLDGLTPVIFQIVPVTNLPLLLGIADQLETSPPFDTSQDDRSNNMSFLYDYFYSTVMTRGLTSPSRDKIKASCLLFLQNPSLQPDRSLV